MSMKVSVYGCCIVLSTVRINVFSRNVRVDLTFAPGDAMTKRCDAEFVQG